MRSDIAGYQRKNLALVLIPVVEIHHRRFLACIIRLGG
jgi:hypothetical protein